IHLPVKAAFLGKIAHPIQALSFKGLVEQPHAPGIGNGDSHHHANGAGLARAVWPQKPKHLTGFNGQAQIVNGNFILVSLTDACEFDNWHACSRRSSSAEESRLIGERFRLAAEKRLSETGLSKRPSGARLTDFIPANAG